MRKTINNCVQCGQPCLGDACPHRNNIILVCDECEEEAELFYFGDEELCIDCITNRLDKVNI